MDGNGTTKPHDRLTRMREEAAADARREAHFVTGYSALTGCTETGARAVYMSVMMRRLAGNGNIRAPILLNRPNTPL